MTRRPWCEGQYGNHCWNIVNSTLRNKIYLNIDRNATIFIEDQANQEAGNSIQGPVLDTQNNTAN